MNDVAFTFDPSQFAKAIDTLTEKMNGLAKSGEEVAGKLSKYLDNVNDSGKSQKREDSQKKQERHVGKMGDMFGGLAKKMIGIGAAYMGFRAIMNKIPEIGRTFSIAGDIISRNFLMPLRMQLVPYLQKVLNWVRDHRAMFVMWGAALANVFQIVKGALHAVYTLLKPIGEGLKKFFDKAFGGTMNSAEKIINMIMFKIAAVIIYLEVALKPVFERLGTAIYRAAMNIYKFVSGVLEGVNAVGGLGEIFEDLIGLLTDIADAFSLNDKEAESFSETLHDIGYVIGVVVGGAIKNTINFARVLASTLGYVFKQIINVVKGIFDIGDAVGKALSGDFSGAMKSIKIAGARFVETHETEGAKVTGAAKRWVKGGLKSQEQVAESMGYKLPWQKGGALITPQKVQKTQNLTATASLRMDKVEIKVGDGEKAAEVLDYFDKKMKEKIKAVVKDVILDGAGKDR